MRAAIACALFALSAASDMSWCDASGKCKESSTDPHTLLQTRLTTESTSSGKELLAGEKESLKVALEHVEEDDVDEEEGETEEDDVNEEGETDNDDGEHERGEGSIAGWGKVGKGSTAAQRAAQAGAGAGDKGDASKKDLEKIEAGEKALQKVKPWRNIALGCIITTLTLVIVTMKLCCYMSLPEHEHHPSPEELRRSDILVREPEGLDACTYTLAITTCIRCLYNLANTSFEDDKRSMRVFKIVFSLLLALCTSAIQIVLVYSTKAFVTPVQVDMIRQAYADYEKHMYMGGAYDPESFNTLQSKNAICQIPLSQPLFFSAVLLVWTVTCLSKIKQCFETFVTVVWITPSIDSMEFALHTQVGSNDSAADGEERTGEGSDAFKGKRDEFLQNKTKSMITADQTELSEEDTNCIVVGVTRPYKLAITCLIMPWFATNTYALWLGCRWLAATNDFSGLIGNCVALEFILHIEEMLFYSWVSDHHKRQLDSVLFLPARMRERVGWFVFFNGAVWALLAISWVYSYMWYWQRVLPNYRWDVRGVCDHFLESIRSKTPPPEVF